MTSISARNAVVLGTITALGPFAIDMYLPAFGPIARDLHVEEGAVQQSLVSFFIALAVGQTVYGPLSDRIGRKRPLIAGLILFFAASVGCALAPSVGWLIVLRFIQGLGGCAGMVLSRAIIRDLHTGEAAARLFALTLLILGVSPVFAPLVGSSIAALGSWRLIFVLIAAIAAATTVMVALLLPETLVAPAETATLRRLLRTYVMLTLDVRFVSAVLAGGFAQAILFAYLAGSSYVFIAVFGTSPFFFSLVFAVNSVALIGVAQTTAAMIRRYGATRVIGTAVWVLAALAVALLALFLCGAATLPVTAAMVFAMMGCLGFVMPPATMLALEPHGEVAGTASALMGTAQFGLGALSGFLVGAFFDGTARPLLVTIALCGLATLASWRIYLIASTRDAQLIA